MTGHRSLNSAKRPALREGDEVRLKFSYPGGDVEIMDCKWIAIVSLGASDRETQSQWVVVDFQGREIWKPLGCLIQAELLEENQETSVRPDETYANATESLGYYC